MGIDLELADVAAARYQLRDCQKSGRPCAHDPVCEENLNHLLAYGPSEFPHRRFAAINAKMRLTGMGYEAEPEFPTILAEVPGDELTDEDRHTAWLRWRVETPPGMTGIPAFKLRSNDRWLVTPREIDEALAAYAKVPVDQRAALEADPIWVSWLRWLALARQRGGFEAE